jgi:2,4-dienoyl-CoA reductase (NADPH2)
MTLLPMVPPGSLVNYAKLVKQQVSVPVIGVGRLTWLLDDRAAAIDRGELDFVALGRAGLADPETVVKTQRGEPQRVRRCLAVNECISRWMFAGLSTQCVINPALGQERRANEARRLVANPQRVLVVGGGPAGCEAAILAADRGHRVELVDRADRIGGQLHAWAAASVFRAEVANMVRFYDTELERAGVTVRLGTDAAGIDLTGWDAVLLATGTVAEEDAGLDAVEMLASGTVPDAAEVTVFGETETALFAALWLAEHGKQVTLVSPAEQPAVDTNDMQRDHLVGLFTGLGGKVTTGGTRPTTGTLVSATPRTASTVLADQVDDDRVCSIGTRFRGGRMYEATQSGYWAAARIGDAR